MTATGDSIAIQAELCAKAPRRPGLWVVLARKCLQAGRLGEALSAAERALALDPRNAAANAVRGEIVAALEELPPGLAERELAAALRPEDPQAHLDLAHAYVDLERPADAERAFKQALELVPAEPEALAGLAAVYLSVGMEDACEHHARRALEVSPGHVVASQALAAVLERRGEAAAAASILDAAYSRQSLFVEPAPQPRGTILVLATRTSGNIPYRYLLPANLYTRLVWFMEHAREDQLAKAPGFDLVFNTIGDPDLAAPTRAIVARVMADCGRPGLNDPDKVAVTCRHLLAGLLGGIEDVVAPRSVRISAAAMQARGLATLIVEAGFAAPLLVRPAGRHGGQGLIKVEAAEALSELPRDLAGVDAYVSEYVDYASRDGFFRKGRMVFVNGEPFPYHWAVSPDWLVHYDNAGMGGEPWRQAEERRFLDDPEGLLGRRAMAAIAAIGARLGLEYCGLDFSLLADGRVLVFEANATMLVHPEDPAGEFAYKNPAVRRITEAFQAMIARRSLG